MANDLWLGTRGYETWVSGPQSGGDTSRIGFSGTIQYINGGMGVVASQAAHREYSWTWGNATSADDIRPIIDFAEGVFDDQDGVNLIYFVDPMASQRNILPQNWATPSLGLGDGMPLLNDTAPQPVDTPANNYRYPARGVRYAGGTDQARLYLPIPPGFTLWVGVHGSATGAGAVKADVVRGANTQSTTTFTMLGTDATLVNTSFDRSAPDDDTQPGGIELYVDTTTSGSTVTLYAMVAQILPTGRTPQGGMFISGQGHSGCQFNGHPTETPYLAADGRYLEAMTAKLVETGAWIS